MKQITIICHRGNLDGPNPEEENTLSYIDKALAEGHEVELDLRVINHQLYLGHDKAQHKIMRRDLCERRHRLWVHCKDNVSFLYCPECRSFAHSSDPFCFVTPGSHGPYSGFVWIHDLTLELTRMSVIPLLAKEDIDNFDLSRAKDVFGICTDYPSYLKDKLRDQ